MGKINYEKKIREYLELGLQIGLFHKDDIIPIYNRIKNVKFKEDNSLTGDARTKIEDGNIVILINKDKCDNKSNYFFDEVIFHELSHLANGIHQDLYINGENKIIKFKREYSKYAKNKPLIKFPEWGAILLDEAIAQKMAQEMVKRKYGKGVYKKKGIQTKLSEPKVSFVTDFVAYPEYEKFAEKFAQTIVGTQGLKGLCKRSVKPNFFDFIVSKYARNKNGLRNLYEELGYMGNIAIADYASKGHFIVPDSETNRDSKNVLESMVKVNMMLDDVLQQVNSDYENR